MKKRTLSIILPNYNYSKFLNASILSILNQTRKPDKLIIIDDGSTDNSLQVIENLIKDFSFVILLKNLANKGVTYSIKKALSFVSTDYVCFTAADDILSCNFVNEMMKFVEENFDISLCCSMPAFFRNSKDIWIDDLNLYKKKIFQSDELVNFMRKIKFWIATHTSIIKTSKIKKEPLYDILEYYSDWFWFLNISFKNKIGYVPKPLAFMRIHEISYSNKKKSYKSTKRIFSFLINKIDNENNFIKKKFIKSRILSSLDKNLLIFLFFRIKYWKYLPMIIYGKILRFLIRIEKKTKKSLLLKNQNYDFCKIKAILKKNNF